MVKLRIEKHITSRSSVMNEIDLKIHDTLEYIKVNPNCNTNPDCLDGHLVEDLHNKEFIKGIKVTHQQSTSPEYISLHITTDGEKHLYELKEKRNNSKCHNPLELKPNFYGLGIDLKKIPSWFNHIINKWSKNK